MTAEKNPREGALPGAVNGHEIGPNDHDESSTVVITRAEYAQLSRDAGLWRRVQEHPELAALIPEWTDVADYAQTLRDAEAWRALMASPHAAEITGEYQQWCERRGMSEVAAAIAGGMDWRGYGVGAVSYAKLERRRGSPTFRRCDYKTCEQGGTPHRSPTTRAQVTLCPAHAHHGIPEKADLSPAAGSRRLGVAA